MRSTTGGTSGTDSRNGWSGVDELVLVDAAGRAPEAFAELYRRHVQRVYSFAWRRTHHRETSEDVVSATFEAAWRRLHSFEASRGQFVNWVLGIAAHELADRHRRAERDRRDRTVAATIALSTSAEAGPEELALRNSGTDLAVLRALDRLPERYQLVLSLRHLEDLTPAETATALGISPSVLAVTSHRARRALRRALEVEGDGVVHDELATDT